MEKKVVRPVVGIGLLIFNYKGEILVVQEKSSKPKYNKEAGMISFPLETQEKKESDLETAVRLIREEADGRFLNFIEGGIRMIRKDFHLISKDPTIVTRYGFLWLKKNAPKNPKIMDPDVSFWDWMTPEELMECGHPLRVETSAIILDFQEKFMAAA